jgi:Leucine-rich repeat (LRR) protein
MLPSDVGLLTSLVILDVTQNALRKLPPQLGFVTSLKSLSLKNNGILPDCIGD